MSMVIELYSPNKYSGSGGYKKSIIVFHTNEAGAYAYGKFPGTAESLAKYLLDPARQASYHKIVDRSGDVSIGVRDEDRAWAAGRVGNNEGLHICALGWAAQSREEWLEYPQQLRAMGVEIAQWSVKEGIPLKKLDPLQLASAEWGIAGHGDVALAWHDTDHTDPGSGFPYDEVIRYAIEHIEGDGGFSVSAGEQVVEQFMGPQRDGWNELAPQRGPDNKSFSIFKFMRGQEPNVTKQTVVEAIATLVFEATLRLLPYRKDKLKVVPETVLGHAAIASGGVLDNQEWLVAIAKQQQRISAALGIEGSHDIERLLAEWSNYPQQEGNWLAGEYRKVTPLDPGWGPPAS